MNELMKQRFLQLTKQIHYLITNLVLRGNVVE